VFLRNVNAIRENIPSIRRNVSVIRWHILSIPRNIGIIRRNSP
jgi:hypothetical protein